MTPQGAVGSNPTLSAIQFYTYSIKSSITRRMTGRLAIATLCLNVSSTAFLYALLIDNLNFCPISLTSTYKKDGIRSTVFFLLR